MASFQQHAWLRQVAYLHSSTDWNPRGVDLASVLETSRPTFPSAGKSTLGGVDLRSEDLVCGNAKLMMFSLSLCSYVTILTRASWMSTSTASSSRVSALQLQQLDLKHFCKLSFLSVINMMTCAYEQGLCRRTCAWIVWANNAQVLIAITNHATASHLQSNPWYKKSRRQDRDGFANVMQWNDWWWPALLAVTWWRHRLAATEINIGCCYSILVVASRNVWRPIALVM